MYMYVYVSIIMPGVWKKGKLKTYNQYQTNTRSLYATRYKVNVSFSTLRKYLTVHSTTHPPSPQKIRLAIHHPHWFTTSWPQFNFYSCFVQGSGQVAATDPGQVLPQLACQDSLRQGAGESSSDLCRSDQQARRAVEGGFHCHPRLPAGSWARQRTWSCQVEVKEWLFELSCLSYLPPSLLTSPSLSENSVPCECTCTCTCTMYVFKVSSSNPFGPKRQTKQDSHAFKCPRPLSTFNISLKIHGVTDPPPSRFLQLFSSLCASLIICSHLPADMRMPTSTRTSLVLLWRRRLTMTRKWRRARHRTTSPWGGRWASARRGLLTSASLDRMEVCIIVLSQEIPSTNQPPPPPPPNY